MESIVQRSTSALVNDLGTFEGFNFHTQSAIEVILTAQEVVDWDHDKQGEAEFWPSGERPGVSLVFRDQTSVTASELLALDALLDGLGDDSAEAYLRIYYACRVCGYSLRELQVKDIEDIYMHVFTGTNFIDLRKHAAYELFELYYPEAYAIWEKTLCDGLIFDVDQFLDSPSFSVEEIQFGSDKALIIAPQ